MPHDERSTHWVPAQSSGVPVGSQGVLSSGAFGRFVTVARRRAALGGRDACLCVFRYAGQPRAGDLTRAGQLNRIGRLFARIANTSDPASPRDSRATSKGTDERGPLGTQPATHVGQVGWIEGGHLGVLVHGPREAADRVATHFLALNEELGGPSLEVEVSEYSAVRAVQERAAESAKVPDSGTWSLPLSW